MANLRFSVTVPDNDSSYQFRRELRSLCSEHGFGCSVETVFNSVEMAMKHQRLKRSEYFAKKNYWTKVRTRKLNKSNAT